MCRPPGTGNLARTCVTFPSPFIACFLWPRKDRFGDELGEEVWEGCNAVFDRLPLASVIDHDIFCVHGGIPRPLPESTSRVQVYTTTGSFVTLARNFAVFFAFGPSEATIVFPFS